jgi:hypothetical protein
VREIVLRNAGGNPGTPTPTEAVTATASVTTSPSGGSPTPSRPGTLPPTPAVSSTPTPTPTPAEDGVGPEITHVGLARADNSVMVPSGSDAQGGPIFSRRFGYGLSLIVEARPGPSHRRPGNSAFNPFGPPDLQLLVSRPLGNGSATVCDDTPRIIGGVPATEPPQFRDDPVVTDAMNDLGCRTDDGAGEPFGRTTGFACTVLDDRGDFSFVSAESMVQFCVPITRTRGFPPGDTIVAVRVRDVAGIASGVREIVVRVGQPASE